MIASTRSFVTHFCVFFFFFSFFFSQFTESPVSAPTTAPTRYPSSFPTGAPTLAPTTNPTNSPSRAPSSAPTNKFCDEGVQTSETYKVCLFFYEIFDTDDLPSDLDIHESNFCNLPDYFDCDSDGLTITQIFFSDYGIVNSIDITGDMIDSYLPLSVYTLDLSNNSLVGTIDFWNKIYRFETLDLSHNHFSGTVDFSHIGETIENKGRGLLSDIFNETDVADTLPTTTTTTNIFNPETDSKLKILNINDNNWDSQAVDWNGFENLPGLERLDLSNNQFAGTIIFIQLESLEYFNVGNNSFSSVFGFSEMNDLEELKEFYINDNRIAEPFDLSWLPYQVTVFECSNNTLTGTLSINSIPPSLTVLNCAQNDFGALEWDVADEYSAFTYALENLSMLSCLLSIDFIVLI